MSRPSRKTGEDLQANPLAVHLREKYDELKSFLSLYGPLQQRMNPRPGYFLHMAQIFRQREMGSSGQTLSNASSAGAQPTIAEQHTPTEEIPAPCLVRDAHEVALEQLANREQTLTAASAAGSEHRADVPVSFMGYFTGYTYNHDTAQAITRQYARSENMEKGTSLLEAGRTVAPQVPSRGAVRETFAHPNLVVFGQVSVPGAQLRPESQLSMLSSVERLRRIYNQTSTAASVPSLIGSVIPELAITEATPVVLASANLGAGS